MEGLETPQNSKDHREPQKHFSRGRILSDLQYSRLGHNSKGGIDAGRIVITIDAYGVLIVCQDLF